MIDGLLKVKYNFSFICTCLWIHADSGWSVWICFVFTWPVNSLLDNKLSCMSQSDCHWNCVAIQAIYLHAKRILCISNIILNINAGHWKSPWKYLQFWLCVAPLSNICSIEKWKSIQNISTLLLHVKPCKIHVFIS